MAWPFGNLDLQSVWIISEDRSRQLFIDGLAASVVGAYFDGGDSFAEEKENCIMDGSH